MRSWRNSGTRRSCFGYAASSCGLCNESMFGSCVGSKVGMAAVLGVTHIIKGWPTHHFIIGSYSLPLVIVMTLFAPAEIIGIAYDSGEATTSTITTPLVTTLGVGLASSIHGRDSPPIDGFCLIVFTRLFPIVTVVIYVQIAEYLVKRLKRIGQPDK
ncbi:DUF1538 family protein [Nitrosomonas mobilis]|nr:DUF1538 family protein [Nitrosomonas mobilis]